MTDTATDSATSTQIPAEAAAELRPSAAVERALSLLASGVPLSLLLDLAGPVPSRAVYAAEGGDAGWLRTA
jgi:hypothetical protein